MKTVSCIIAAYNEAPRISVVLKAVCGHPMVGEVLVFDDASHDDTAAVAQSFPGVTVVHHTANVGKTRSVVEGVRAACGDVLLLLDADLEGITSDHVTRLIEPVISGRADVSVSLRQNAPWFYRTIGLDFLTGERVIPKALVEPCLDEMAHLPKFGLEVYMNERIIEHTLRIAVVPWKGVESPWKYKKEGFWTGLWDEVKMNRDILHTISAREALVQITTLRRLRVKPYP